MRPSEAESSKGVEKGALGSLAQSTSSGTDAALIARGDAWRAGDDCVTPMGDAARALLATGVRSWDLPRLESKANPQFAQFKLLLRA